ncbi:MAG TPA: DUF5939 domain-containing protein [Polyangiaceae bacterium]|nr:DUF5939 domain-containing protein [Polyangiaceae bacterium]
MAEVNETLLDEQLGELEKLRSWSPRVISKLENFIRTADDWSLFRVNPYYFAEERGVSEDEAVDLFLLAGKVGLFQMTWNLLCPGCGAAVQSFATLRSLCAAFHCGLCNVDLETQLDDYVQVGFTISPKIRAIAAHDIASLSVEDLHLRYTYVREARVAPGGPRFTEFIPQATFGLTYLAPHETRSFEINVEPGILAVHDLLNNSLLDLIVDPKQPTPNAPMKLRLQDGAQPTAASNIAPGALHIELTNDSDKRASAHLFFKPQAVIDQMMAMMAAGKPFGMHFDRFLTGRKLLTSQTFRQVFGTEIIRSSEGLGVRDITILFTDLKGSTEMYDRIGDLKAFALVNQHFDRLARAIIRHHGAVVKTIGDAVMASFETPSNAVFAARDMLREIEAFNREVGEREIVLKVGVHRGASIAVTLNDRLDFFGQTVNIAARVQGLADADEIYLTDDVYRAAGVKDLLREMQVTPREVQLRGVQKPVAVYRASHAG